MECKVITKMPYKDSKNLHRTVIFIFRSILANFRALVELIENDWKIKYYSKIHMQFVSKKKKKILKIYKID